MHKINMPEEDALKFISKEEFINYLRESKDEELEITYLFVNIGNRLIINVSGSVLKIDEEHITLEREVDDEDITRTVGYKDPILEIKKSDSGEIVYRNNEFFKKLEELDNNIEMSKKERSDFLEKCYNQYNQI